MSSNTKPSFVFAEFIQLLDYVIPTNTVDAAPPAPPSPNTPLCYGDILCYGVSLFYGDSVCYGVSPCYGDIL